MFGPDEGNSIVGSYKTFVHTQGYNGSISVDNDSVMVSYSSINWILNSIGPAIGTILRKKLKVTGS